MIKLNKFVWYTGCMRVPHMCTGQCGTETLEACTEIFRACVKLSLSYAFM
jgi:hypothetical protein